MRASRESSWGNAPSQPHTSKDIITLLKGRIWAQRHELLRLRDRVRELEMQLQARKEADHVVE